jgi:hypothetical protein
VRDPPKKRRIDRAGKLLMAAVPTNDAHMGLADLVMSGQLAPATRSPIALRTTARSLKTTLVLNPESFVGLTVPNGVPKFDIAVEVAGRTVTASVNAKAVRKAAATVAEHGPEQVAVILQGGLMLDNTLAEAGLVAQVKTPKAPA